jgi:hypothetical protein
MKVCFITCSCIPDSPFYRIITLLHKTHQPVQYFITQSESFSSYTPAEEARLISLPVNPLPSPNQTRSRPSQARLDKVLFACANIPVAFFLASCQNFRAYVFLYFHHQKHQQSSIGRNLGQSNCLHFGLSTSIADQPQRPAQL